MYLAMGEFEYTGFRGTERLGMDARDMLASCCVPLMAY